MTLRIVTAVVALALPRIAVAQTPDPAFAVTVTFVATDSGQFHTKDVGIGGGLGWRVTPLIGLEGELTHHSDPFGDAVSFSAGRIEGLFGATIGPQLGAVRPLVSVRPGFVRYQAADEPIVCIAIFPPPLSCTLAAGRTLFAFDLGGGVEISPTVRTLIRATLSDRMIRYRGPAFDTNGERHDNSFASHDLRFALGAGFRF